MKGEFMSRFFVLTLSLWPAERIPTPLLVHKGALQRVDPPDAQFINRAHMLLSSNTLVNLEVYRNQTDGGAYGSLVWRTLFGFAEAMLTAPSS